MVSKAHVQASLQRSEISIHALCSNEENKTQVKSLAESRTQVLIPDQTFRHDTLPEVFKLYPTEALGCCQTLS